MSTYLYIADTYNSRLVKRLASDLSFVSKIGSLGTGNDQFNGLRGVATDGTHLYIADSLNHRIVKRLASDLSYVSRLGSPGSGNDQFNNPESIAISGSYLYILDTNNHRLVKRLASDLSYVSKTGTQGTGNDQFYYPRGIATDGTHLYIADTSGQRIKKHLASDLSYVSKACTQGAGNDQVQAPEGVTVSGSDLFVGDTYNHRVVKRLASDLSYRSQIGSYGTGNDQFYLLCRLANDGTYLYVADTFNNRIVKRLLSDLSYVSRLGSLGTGNDQFNHPYSIAVGAEAPAPPPLLSVRPIAARSYWKRFMSRNPNYKGRLMEIYEGQVGMLESEFRRTWVGKLSNVTTKNGEFTFESTDLLKDLSKIDVPPKLDIKLATELSDAETQQITLTSVDGLDAAAGYIRIKDEIIGYAALDAVTKALQTITRGAFNTVAAAYAARDKVQKVRYYAPGNPWDILLEMLRTDAGIADADIDTAAFELAKRTPGNDLMFRAVISEPTSLDKLFFEITDILDAKAWVGEDLRITIRRNVQNAPGRAYYRLTDGNNIVDDSASVDFNEKSRLTRMLIYWHKSVLGKIDDPAAFDRLDIAVDAEAEASYGDVVEKKVFCRWIDPITNEEDSAETYVKNLGMRQVRRRRDAQPLIALSLSMRDLAIKTGDHVRLATDELVKFNGDPIANDIFQVVKRELQDDFSLKISLLRVSTRRLALIAPGGYPNYLNATDSQREYGFITLPTGLMENEDEGYYIW
jgi:hypothetical protein